MSALVGGILMVLCTLVEGQKPTETAFTAALTHHSSVTVGNTVIYDTVFTNIGNGYDSTTGVFTCPQDGLYVFQVHGLSRTNSTLWLDLYHNYNYVASAYAHTTSDFAAAGNSAILHLYKGDTVLVMAEGLNAGDTTDLYGDAQEIYCTFSGYLVAAVFEEHPIIG